MATLKLGRRALAAVSAVARPTILYDSDLKGFGLRLTPGGSQTWIVEYRPGAGGRGVAKKRISLGSTSTLSPERARDAARTMLANVRLGADPNAARAEERGAKTIAELQPLYAAEWDPVRKPRTVQLYGGYWNGHILPALGSTIARKVTKQELTRLHREIGAEHKTTANRVLTLLAHFYGWAADAGYVSKGFNPCDGIERFGESGRERYLSEAELSRLGAALERAENVGVDWPRDEGKLSKHAPKAAEHRRVKIDADAGDAIRLLVFTGARLREILHLEWAHFDRQRMLLLLPDSKTGRKTIVLGGAAAEVLERLWTRATRPEGVAELKAPLSRYVFPSRDLRTPKADLKRPWLMVTREAGLEGLRVHDLRHSFASVGVAADLGLPVIGRLLGHTKPETTARYAHLAATPLRNATNLIAGTLAAAMATRAAIVDESAISTPFAAS